MANTDTVADPTATSFFESLLELFRQAHNPDLCQAQNILLRRLALQGDVVGSRVPAPQNITEIGGYLNMLREFKQEEMLAQVLAGILGVAGPNPPLGWTSSRPPLRMVPLTNDRPEGASQSAIPLWFMVRSDFYVALQQGRNRLHEQGCVLPLSAAGRRLPPASSLGPSPTDLLPYLGRCLELVPAAALNDPAADLLALVRPAGTTEAFRIAARVLAPGSVSVPAADWDAQKCDSSSCRVVQITGGQFVPVAPILASAGFYSPTPLPEPVTILSTEWTRLTNCTGLIRGKTKLGDELEQLYDTAEIGASVFATMLNWLWDGSTFVKP
ncbi:MAG: hypothetical protein BWY83_02823 [bacterium ADurb.Bin478]|nr:MAG: hypothetical protein BWY83_02823 [bacterium ADurb.Bin478]